jgi:hypothetical protein
VEQRVQSSQSIRSRFGMHPEWPTSQIEDTIECKYINAHGTFDIKNGSSANG